MVGIYGIHNLMNDMWYVGQSINIDKRWKQHKWALNNKYHYNTRLQHSWDKYGECNFEFLILDECTVDELDSKEIHWIKELNSLENGYNLCEGGNSVKGRIITDEMRMKESLNRLGDKNPMYGKSQTEFHKSRMKEIQSGSLNHMFGKYGEQHPRSKKIKCIDTNVVYNALAEAERETGIDRNNISACCNGRLKTAGKFRWEYYNE